MSRKTRRRFGPSEKLQMVLAGLSGTESIADLCRREGISTVQFYEWKKRLLSSADEVYGRPRKPSKREETLAETLVRKDQIIAQITEENLQLKKNPGAVLDRYLHGNGGR